MANNDAKTTETLATEKNISLSKPVYKANGMPRKKDAYVKIDRSPIVNRAPRKMPKITMHEKD